jgi:hypothetical protein
MNGNGKVKKVMIFATFVATVLGIGVSWQALDLPRPVTDNELEQALKVQYENHTELRSTVLNDIRQRLSREMSDIEQRIWHQRQMGEDVPEWMLRERADIKSRIEKIDRELQTLGTQPPDRVAQ